MSKGIPQQVLDEILSRVDIVELISGFIPLKRAGRNFKALCPFHQEKTASFMINPDKQIYHCFGCGKGGNAFNFLMQYEHIDFPEAVEQLAKRTGVLLPKERQNPQELSLNTLLYKINELAALYYQNILHSPEGSLAKDYFLRRGLHQDILEKFKLGFATDKWDGLLTYLRTKGITLNLLEKSGLIIAKEGGGYFDRFRGRLIFPIFDIKGRILAFGARILDAHKEKELAKYINSPETPVYIKGRNLYGLNFSKVKILKEDCAIIVEGYMDFLSVYQAGIENVLASQGTALTIEQVRLLKRYTHNVVIIFDADSAGQTAALRSLDIFIEEDMQVSAVDLPSGYDPDSFVRKMGPKALKEKIDSAVDFFDYKLAALKAQFDMRKVSSKARIVSEMLFTINKFKNAVLKSEYIRRLAQALDIQEGLLLQELKNLKDNTYYTQKLATAISDTHIKMSPTEKLLLRLMLQEAEIVENLKGHIEPADFQSENAARIVSAIFDLCAKGRPVQPNQLINYFSESEISNLIGELGVSEELVLEEAKRKEIIFDCVQRLKKQRLHTRKEQLQEEIKLAQELKDEERLNLLTREFQQLMRGGIRE